jgi:hypothetical protein
MFGIFQVQQSPKLGIGFEDNIATLPAITTVRTTVWHPFGPEKMCRPGTPVAGFTIDFDVIYKVGIGQSSKVK